MTTEEERGHDFRERLLAEYAPSELEKARAEPPSVLMTTIAVVSLAVYGGWFWQLAAGTGWSPWWAAAVVPVILLTWLDLLCRFGRMRWAYLAASARAEAAVNGLAAERARELASDGPARPAVLLVGTREEIEEMRRRLTEDGAGGNACT